MGTEKKILKELKTDFEILFRYPYVKLSLLIISVFLAYYSFANPSVENIISKLGALNYLGIFLAGTLFSFGFTTPFAIGFFLTSNPENILLGALLGGLGATLADLTILKIIRLSLIDDFNRLKKISAFSYLSLQISKRMPAKIKVYLFYSIAGLIIASPLPDELGITMLAGFSHIKAGTLAIICFVMNALGIFILLSL